MVDVPRIESRLQRLGELLGELDEIHAGGRGAYDASFRLRLATQHGMQLAIQACIDIAGHLVAEEGAAVPDDYAGLFTELRQAGLQSDLADRMVRATGLRNVLVHGYLDLDEDVLWGALDHLGDLRAFAGFAAGRLR